MHTFMQGGWKKFLFRIILTLLLEPLWHLVRQFRAPAPSGFSKVKANIGRQLHSDIQLFDIKWKIKTRNIKKQLIKLCYNVFLICERKVILICRLSKNSIWKEKVKIMKMLLVLVAIFSPVQHYTKPSHLLLGDCMKIW